ncbi:MAG: hypothetical protein AAGJ81_14145 [Verrucomicrobiota bacterium]
MSLFLLIAGLLVAEILIAYGYTLLARWVYKRIGFDLRSIIKGVIERGFLVICLLNGYPHALTLFGALKLGTRLKRDDADNDEKTFNDYYLLGNLISVSIAIGYVKIIQEMFS